MTDMEWLETTDENSDITIFCHKVIEIEIGDRLEYYIKNPLCFYLLFLFLIIQKARLRDPH